MQPDYAQPLAPPDYIPPSQTGNVATNQPIVTNQVQPQVVNVVTTPFGTTPVSLTCQFCKNPVTTTVQTQCNCCTFCLCWLTGIVFFVCVQCCRGKELGCCDATHVCPKCGQTLGYYNSC